MTPAEQHNALASDYVMKVGAMTSSTAQIAVILESVILGSMRLMARLYGTPPRAASGLVEAAVQRAIERFSKDQAHG